MATYYEREFSRVHRIVSWLSHRCNFAYTSRRGIARGLKRKGGLAFLPTSAEGTPEEKFLHGLDLKGKTVFDIGGFVGLMTLFFASRAKHVYTFEPNPLSRDSILANLKLNGFDNVTLRPVALGDKQGILTLVIDDLMSGGASGDPEISNALLSSATNARTIQAELTTVDRELEGGLPVPDFVKVDVEGMEYFVLQGMRSLLKTRKPWVYFELHGTDTADKLRNASDVINGLREFHYEIYDIEQGSIISPDQAVTGKESHIFGK